MATKKQTSKILDSDEVVTGTTISISQEAFLIDEARYMTLKIRSEPEDWLRRSLWVFVGSAVNLVAKFIIYPFDNSIKPSATDITVFILLLLLWLALLINCKCRKSKKKVLFELMENHFAKKNKTITIN